MGAKKDVVIIEVEGGKEAKFTLGVPGVVEIEGEYGPWSLRTMKVKMADGSTHEAIGEFSDVDSGEHGGTGLLSRDGREFVWQGDPGFLEALGKTSEEVFPYRYKPYIPCSRDHHIGEDGWSR